MPKPLWNSLWLKLFGPEGVTTVAEFRDAIMNARLGSAAADGNVIASVRSLVSAHLHDQAQAGSGGDGAPFIRLLGPDGAFLLSLRLPEISGAVDEGERVSVPATQPVSGDSASLDPAHALASGGRSVTLLVAADPAVAAGLVPIEYGPASSIDYGPAHGEGRFGDGWLATWLTQQAAVMQVGWDADALGLAVTDLGLLLGPVLGSIELSGDYSAGFTLARLSTGLDQVTLAAGHDYNLIVDDNCVGAGQSLTVDASALGAGDHAAFDGSTVTDASFTLVGGSGSDLFFGGSGADVLRGAGGADTLTGGGGGDTFVYLGAGDSTGAAYDTLADFNPAQDKIDLPGTVTGFDTAIQSGALSTASFSADLGTALSGLGAGHAVVYAPDAGDLAGKIFLVVDGNGVAGYQEGEDYVFALPATTLADLSAHPNFFV